MRKGRSSFSRSLLRIFLACCACLLATAGAVARAETIDDVIGSCPSAAEMAAIDAVITITVEGGDPSAPTLVCTAAAGSRNLTKLMRNIYNVLRVAQKLRFSQPLPWSSQTSIWDWLRLESGVNMIRLRNDTGMSFCCDPPNAINIQIQNNVITTFDKWVEDNFAGAGLVGGLALIVHEARHHNGGGHNCGSNDDTLEQLGAWGAQLYFYVWLDRYADRSFLKPNNGDPLYYRNWHIQTAEDIKRLLCHPPTPTPGTVVEFYNTVLDHYFMTISAAEQTAIDNGSAGPGWSRTGVTFSAWPNADTAPLNARPVCRFYGSVSPGPNSHFYTVDDAECASLKQLQAQTPDSEPRWNYEGIAFYVGVPVRGSPTSQMLSCDFIPVLTPALFVNRFYNKRAQLNDSNHRYTVSANASNQMNQLGWGSEGLAMCANP